MNPDPAPQPEPGHSSRRSRQRQEAVQGIPNSDRDIFPTATQRRGDLWVGSLQSPRRTADALELRTVIDSHHNDSDARKRLSTLTPSLPSLLKNPLCPTSVFPVSFVVRPAPSSPRLRASAGNHSPLRVPL